MKRKDMTPEMRKAHDYLVKSKRELRKAVEVAPLLTEPWERAALIDALDEVQEVAERYLEEARRRP